MFDMSKATPLPGSGEQLNDVGNRVIVPKEGESFADTMKRAVASGRTVTPEQLGREEQTMPTKALATLGLGPIIGAGGAAALAGPGEAVAATLPRVLPATVDGVKAVGAWANAHPLQAYALYKILFEHNAIAKFIKGAPTAPEE